MHLCNILFLIIGFKNITKQQIFLQVQSALFCIKGKIYEAMDNRNFATDCYKEALRNDVHCYEAFQALIQHQMLTSDEG